MRVHRKCESNSILTFTGLEIYYKMLLGARPQGMAEDISIDWIVAKCGGARAIADQIGRHIDTVYKWSKIGIQDRYWTALAEMSGGDFKAHEVFYANEKLRNHTKGKS